MSSKVIYILVALSLLIFSLAILANSMTKPLGRDEQMYCTGGALIAQGKMIYRDFSYVAQMPYHPLLCAAVFRLFNTTHYLLAGRLISTVCDVLVMLCIIAIYRYTFKPFEISGMLFGLAGAAMYVFNPSVDYSNGHAWNNDVVILCVMVSFRLFISTDFKQQSKYWRIACIGALLTLATCMRITTVLVQILFFIALLTKNERPLKQELTAVLTFLLASAIVLIWPVWLIFQAPRAFILDAFVIQILNSDWLHKIGLVHNKFALTYDSVTKPGYLALIVLTVYLFATTVRLRRRLSISNKPDLLLASLLPLWFFIIALSLPTIWKQHLAAPAPFLIIAAAYPLLHLRKLAPLERDLYSHPVKDLSLRGISFLTGLAHKTGLKKHFNFASALIAMSVLIAIASYPVVLRRIPMLLRPQGWTPNALHRISEDIAKNTREPKLILTLAPLYALEGGCDIYTELSAGSFVYRVADYMSPADRAVTRSVSPETLEELLEKMPPSAVVLGTEMEILEEGLFKTTVEPAVAKPAMAGVERPSPENWKRKVYENGPVVYFRR